MTIAAGFLCSDGIVVCAETEETTRMFKLPKSKIFVFDGLSCKVIIAGAGYSDFVHLAVEKIQERVKEPELTLQQIKEVVEDVVGWVHKEHLYAIPTTPGETPSIELLVGIWSEKQGIAGLLRTTSTVVLEVNGCGFIGYGNELSQYLAVTLYSPEISRTEAIHLASYILMQAKRYVRYCGGRSEIVVLDEHGEFRPDEVELYSRDREAFFEEFGKFIQPIFYQTPNVQLSNDDFERILDGFCIDVRSLREQYKVLHSASVKRKEEIDRMLRKLNEGKL